MAATKIPFCKWAFIGLWSALIRFDCKSRPETRRHAQVSRAIRTAHAGEKTKPDGNMDWSNGTLELDESQRDFAEQVLDAWLQSKTPPSQGQQAYEGVPGGAAECVGEAILAIEGSKTPATA